MFAGAWAEQREVLRAFAATLGAEFIPDRGSAGPRVVAHAGSWEITIEAYADDHATMLRMICEPERGDDFAFSITRTRLSHLIASDDETVAALGLWLDSALKKLGKGLGLQDIEIGVPQFDRDFVVKSNDAARVRRLFSDRELVELMQDQPTVDLRMAPLSVAGRSELLCMLPGAIADPEQLGALYRLFVAMLRRLEAIGPADPSRPEMMSCRHCGAVTHRGDRFCIHCGAPLGDAASPALGATAGLARLRRFLDPPPAPARTETGGAISPPSTAHSAGPPSVVRLNALEHAEQDTIRRLHDTIARVVDSAEERSAVGRPGMAPPCSAPAAGDPAWETCEIGYREAGRTTLDIDLQLVAIGDDGGATIVSSPSFRQRSYEKQPSPYSNQAMAALEQLSATLVADGWEPVAPAGAAWYGRRFRRRRR